MLGRWYRIAGVSLLLASAASPQELAPEVLLPEALNFAAELASGPTFAHAMTKKMLQQEWNMGGDEAIEAEAQAQAICMATNDFHRAYHAFVEKQKPEFEGN